MRQNSLPEFYEWIQELLPVRLKSGDFKGELNRLFEKYFRKVILLDADIEPEYGEHILRGVRRVIDSISQSVSMYFEGMHSKAYGVMERLLLGDGTRPGILQEVKMYELEVGTPLFRGRVFENNRKRTYNEMFHIPFDRRGKVKTQRYSSPGYPCLYLGTTICACWEELNQPRFDDLMVSKFRPVRNIKLLDLRNPSKENYVEENLFSLLVSLPLIIACSVVVSNPGDTFKPEYIIPQLLIEFIITNNNTELGNKNHGELMMGVIYRSTHINHGLEFKKDVFDNIAIPAINTSHPTGFCHYIASCFKLTDPTCFEYEEIKRPFKQSWFEVEPQTHDEELELNYRSSKMGMLEARLDEFPMYQFKYRVSPQRMFFQTDLYKPPYNKQHGDGMAEPVRKSSRSVELPPLEVKKR